ncbi:MAG: heat-shock protein Hsp70 [Desulfobacterales bacterium]|nr:MAG: heat-shock protein Hsp70 [Desulfobacterales bacterium]
MTVKIVGIDLGTTNSEIAYYEDGAVKIIEGPDGKLLPSYVGLDEQENLLVGGLARNQYVLYPERTIKSVKRLMGQATQLSLGKNTYSPQEISAMILRNLKNIAESHLGYPVSEAVITVPAFFSDSQRQATVEAGKIAGLNVKKIINEPTAATLVYESDHKGARKVLVYDLGGGTFDVSVVELQDDVIEVVASHGNNNLGGDDFDNLVERWLLTRLEEDSITEIPPGAMARLRRAAEKAKKELSSQPYAVIEEEYLLEQDNTPYNLRVELSRAEYEKMISTLVDETLDAVHLVLKDAGLTPTDIDQILLVGGSTRTPLIQNRLERVFHIPPRFEVDPDLCVAAGAAMQAAMLQGEDVRAVLVDVTPYTFGVTAIGEVDGEFTMDMFVPLIKKNTPIPVTRSEVFYTGHDDQPAVEIRVSQGEAPYASENIEVGNFQVKGLARARAGSEIIATFALNSNGILTVSAQEKATGLEKSIVIHNVLSDSSEDSVASARKKIRHLFEDENSPKKMPKHRGEADEKAEGVGALKNTSIVQAKAVIEKAQALFEEACEEDKEDMVDLIEEIQLAIAEQAEARLHEKVEELSEIIFFMET